MKLPKLLRKILVIQTYSHEEQDMRDFICHYGKSQRYTVLRDKIGNIYLVKGLSKTYPCIVAHMDTVHHIHKNGWIHPIVFGDRVTGFNPDAMQQTGIGGDDKCGVYAALRVANQLPACKMVFFVGEERGCVGSRGADLDFFKDCRFILQADRRGNDDWVDNICGKLGSDEFQDAVRPIRSKFKYTPSNGMMTDVKELRDRGVGISVANMSAAYYEPHCRDEYIIIPELEDVCNMILEICQALTEVFPFVYEPPVWKNNAAWQENKWQNHHHSMNDYVGDDDKEKFSRPQFPPSRPPSDKREPWAKRLLRKAGFGGSPILDDNEPIIKPDNEIITPEINKVSGTPYANDHVDRVGRPLDDQRFPDYEPGARNNKCERCGSIFPSEDLIWVNGEFTCYECINYAGYP